MIQQPGVHLGGFKVTSVSGRGFTPEELAEQALEKIIHVGGSSHPVVRQQAEAFKNEIRGVLISYMKQAVASNNTTLKNKFIAHGHQEFLKLLEV
jgi:hypothetical protein